MEALRWYHVNMKVKDLRAMSFDQLVTADDIEWCRTNDSWTVLRWARLD